MRTDFENMPRDGDPFVVLYADHFAVDIWQWTVEGGYKGWSIIMSNRDFDFIDESEEMPKMRGWCEIPDSMKPPST